MCENHSLPPVVCLKILKLFFWISEEQHLSWFSWLSSSDGRRVIEQDSDTRSTTIIYYMQLPKQQFPYGDKEKFHPQLRLVNGNNTCNQSQT